MNVNTQKPEREECPKTPLKCPVTVGSTPVNESTHIEWEVPYISSKQQIQTFSGLFHYETVVSGYSHKKEDKETYSALFRTKLAPLSIKVKDKSLSFKVYYNISVCQEIPKIQVPVNNIMGRCLVLTKEELVPDLIYSKYLVFLENFIDSEYTPKILNRFKQILESHDFM